MRGDQSQASLPWSSPVLHPAELPLPRELLAQHSQRGAHSTFQTFPSHVVELCLTPAPWLRQRRWGALPLHRDGAGTPLPYPPCPGPPWGPPHEAPFLHPFWVQVFGVPWSSRAFHFGMQTMGRRKHTACGSSVVGAGTGDHPWGAPGASCHPTGHPPPPWDSRPSLQHEGGARAAPVHPCQGGRFGRPFPIPPRTHRDERSLCSSNIACSGWALACWRGRGGDGQTLQPALAPGPKLLPQPRWVLVPAG